MELALFDNVMLDGLKNGQIQKFEYCTELLWKTMKLFLLEQDGVEAKSPKAVVKEFFLAGHIDQGHYESLVQMIDDRNTLTHLYAEGEFERIIGLIPMYISIMSETLNKLHS